MAVELDYFPHSGGHCENDERQAHLTLWLLGMFAICVVFAIVYIVSA